MTNQLVAILVGILTLVVGLTLAPVVLQSVGQSLDSIENVPASTGVSDLTFAGAQSITNLIPVVYFTVIVSIGIGMIGAGALGMLGRGLMANRG